MSVCARRLPGGAAGADDDSLEVGGQRWRFGGGVFAATTSTRDVCDRGLAVGAAIDTPTFTAVGAAIDTPTFTAALAVTAAAAGATSAPAPPRDSLFTSSAGFAQNAPYAASAASFSANVPMMCFTPL